MVDTRSWEVNVKSLDHSAARWAEVTVDLVNAVLLVSNTTVGVTASDKWIVTMSRSKGESIVLVANKVDSSQQEADAVYLWSLGMGKPHLVSALRGRGTDDLFDAVLETLLEGSVTAAKMPGGGPRCVAPLGRPNAGKSSLFNVLAGPERVMVSELAGTTRDLVDELIEPDGEFWRFADTVDIRHKMHRTTDADYYASIRTQVTLEKAEVALILFDGSESLTEQDIRTV